MDNADCIAKDLVGEGLIDGKNLVVGEYTQCKELNIDK